MSKDAESIRARAVELGFLSMNDADAAMSTFRAGGAGSNNFASFLLEVGAVNLSQMQALQQATGNETDMGMTYADPSLHDPVVGMTFSGCKVERKLGQGGMGAVYLAHREDGHEVVVKFLAPEQAANPTWRGRFIREAEVMKQIDHTNVVGVYSVDGASERPHIVMEFVDGAPLDELLEQQEVFEPQEACRIARDIALGLSHAHAGGVIHRDIKPANVLISKAGEVKVLDFGLAKNVEVDDGLSMPGQILGTPHYMAPEQWGDHMVDARCDVFSLGATLYHMITGSVPFPGKTPTAISRKVLSGDFERPSAFVPDLPEDLELVIHRAMALNRSYRYPTAKSVADDLQRVLDGDEVEVPRLVAQESGKRFPLLPGETFLIGRDDNADISIRDRSVSRQHARIERGKTGYVLSDLGSTYGSFVGGMRIRSVVLKKGDTVKLGKVALEFCDGGLAEAALSTRRLNPDRMRVRTLPIPFVQSLIENADKRVVLPLLERLAPDDMETRIRLTQTKVGLRCGGGVATQVVSKMTGQLKRQRMRVPHYLFTITHENLADDVEAWLGWWDHTRASYPAQIAPQAPQVPARLKVLGGEPEPRTIALEGHVRFTLGRDDKSTVKLLSRSVSRLHATIIRFHNRLVIRDEGSRFGTVLNGKRVKLAFLKPGDMLTMGKVEMTFEVDDPDPSATMAESDKAYIDDEAWFALADMGHAATADGLVGFLEIEQDASWIRTESQGLFSKNPDRAAKFAAVVTRAYGKQADRARKALPKILGQDLGGDLEGWYKLLREREPELPVQLLPEGWFPATTESGTLKLP